MANGVPYQPMIERMFAFLATQNQPELQAPGTLASRLRSVMKGKDSQFTFRPKDASLYASAAVEMWLRSIHSFLISAALNKASPIWASVSGYYASHYCMRAFSHLFGRFLLARDHSVVQMSLNHGFACEVLKKQGAHEHQLYWKLPHQEFGSTGNTVFADNPMIQNDSNTTDGFHRVYANYYDHLYTFPEFEILDETYLRARIERLSELVNDSPTVPNHRNFPDLDSVQIIAYARIIRFRSFLDNVIGPSNRYWSRFRNPKWFTKYMDFQTIENSTLNSEQTRLRVQ